MFKRHHYLTGNLPKCCRCYAGLIAGRPVAFAAIAPQMGFAGYWRFGRVVVLPDYQGIGVGGRFRDAVAEIEVALPQVRRLSLVTSHPAMIRSLAKSPHWRCRAMCYSNGTAIRAGRPLRPGCRAAGSAVAGRMVVSFVYSSSRGHTGQSADQPELR